MSELAWKPFYCINVPEIDEQHQKLVEMINQLARSIDKGIVNDEMGKVLIQLVDYTQYHFKTEEKVMEQIGYAGLGEQKNLHREFIRQLAVIIKKVRDGQNLNVFDLMGFLQNWLINHIVNKDMNIGKAYQAKKVQPAIK